MTEITAADLEKSELKIFCDRAETALMHYYEPEPGLFIAETPLIAGRAFQAGYVPVSVLGEKKTIEKTMREIPSLFEGIPVCCAHPDVLRSIAGYELTRGFLCAMRRKELPSVDEVLGGSKRAVILENVMNPANAGAIFRSAAALGMDAVLLTGGSTDPLYRRAIRVSMGAVFRIPWTFIDGKYSPAARIALLKERGFLTCAMALSENAESLKQTDFSGVGKLAVFMGSEFDGLCEETISACDRTVTIPMKNGMDSLNVAAASAVVFWELCR